jgi:hypothetical protein
MRFSSFDTQIRKWKSRPPPPPPPKRKIRRTFLTFSPWQFLELQTRFFFLWYSKLEKWFPKRRKITWTYKSFPTFLWKESQNLSVKTLASPSTQFEEIMLPWKVIWLNQANYRGPWGVDLLRNHTLDWSPRQPGVDLPRNCTLDWSPRQAPSRSTTKPPLRLIPKGSRGDGFIFQFWARRKQSERRERVGDMAYVEMRETKEAGLLCRVPASSAHPPTPAPGQSTGMREGEQWSGRPPKVGPMGSGHPADKRGRRPDWFHPHNLRK